MELKGAKEGTYYFHAFNIFPTVDFPEKDGDERVILTLRSHPITQLPWVINAFIFSVLVLVVFFFLRNILQLNQLIFLYIFSFLIIIGYIWINFLSWFFNIGIITTKRILDIDFQSLAYKEVTGSNIVNIEDITSKMSGFFSSSFNFGDLFIQTAAKNDNIEFLNIPQPTRVVRIINELREDVNKDEL